MLLLLGDRRVTKMPNIDSFGQVFQDTGIVCSSQKLATLLRHSKSYRPRDVQRQWRKAELSISQVCFRVAVWIEVIGLVLPAHTHR